MRYCRKPNVTLDENGCGEVKLNSSEISRLVTKARAFQATALVEEEGTGVVETKMEVFQVKLTRLSQGRLPWPSNCSNDQSYERISFVLQVKDVPFVLTFGAGSSASSRTHVLPASSGSFPLLQQVRIASHDGSPLEGERVEVCARLYTDIKDLRQRVGSLGHLFYRYTEEQFIQLAELLLKIRHG